MKSIRYLNPLIFAAAGLGLPLAAHAATLIASTAGFNTAAGRYDYSYSITNSGGLDDLALITIPVDPSSNVMGITSPTGFTLTFDASQGWINISEDESVITDQTFAPGSTRGTFNFSSVNMPGTVTFTAFDAGGNESSGEVLAPVPEPAGLMLLGVASSLVFLRNRRSQS